MAVMDFIAVHELNRCSVSSTRGQVSMLQMHGPQNGDYAAQEGVASTPAHQGTWPSLRVGHLQYLGHMVER